MYIRSTVDVPVALRRTQPLTDDTTDDIDAAAFDRALDTLRE